MIPWRLEISATWISTKYLICWYSICLYAWLEYVFMEYWIFVKMFNFDYWIFGWKYCSWYYSHYDLWITDQNAKWSNPYELNGVCCNCVPLQKINHRFALNIGNVLGVIHKPPGQNFVYFWPSFPLRGYFY